MKKTPILVLPLACLLLSSCAGKEILPPCPQVAIVRALETFEDYGSDRPDPSTLVAVAKMDDVVGSCEYTDEGVDLSFMVKMRALKGKRLGGNQVSIPYFVSVVGEGSKIVSKEIMTASFTFTGKPVSHYQEQLHVVLPYASADTKFTGRRVLMGFQLTQEQRIMQRMIEERKMKRKLEGKQKH